MPTFVSLPLNRRHRFCSPPRGYRVRWAGMPHFSIDSVASQGRTTEPCKRRQRHGPSFAATPASACLVMMLQHALGGALERWVCPSGSCRRRRSEDGSASLGLAGTAVPRRSSRSSTASRRCGPCEACRRQGEAGAPVRCSGSCFLATYTNHSTTGFAAGGHLRGHKPFVNDRSTWPLPWLRQERTIEVPSPFLETFARTCAAGGMEKEPPLKHERERMRERERDFGSSRSAASFGGRSRKAW